MGGRTARNSRREATGQKREPGEGLRVTSFGSLECLKFLRENITEGQAESVEKLTSQIFMVFLRELEKVSSPIRKQPWCTDL